MKEPLKIPFYAKTALIFISLFAFVYTLSIAQNIIVPIVYATLLAILVNPLVNFLCRKGINRFVSIMLTVLMALCLVLTLFYAVYTQASHFSDSFSQMNEKFIESSNEFMNWISKKTNIHTSILKTWVNEMQKTVFNNLALKENFTRFSNVMVTVFLIPVYMVMVLYYKPLLLDFIRKVFRLKDHNAVEEVLSNAKKIIQNYLVGLFIEMLIVAMLNSIGLYIIGMEYILLLALLGAFLNLIPYLGSIIATAIFMLVALLTKTPIYMLYVFILYTVINFIDNNFLIPKVVAARVKINALFSIMVVIIGGAIWGIAGMFIAIPITAIVKVIFDHIDSLKPFGYLLGENVPESQKNPLNFIKKIFERPKPTTL